MYRAGWIGLSYPPEAGGRGLPESYDAILNEEMAAAGAPPLRAIGHLARAIALHGTPEQRERHVRPMLACEVMWCQGFSEPGAGSDLASIASRAVAGADGVWRVTGHKIWTSEARWADWCLVLVRTDPEAPRHQGPVGAAAPHDGAGDRGP